MTPETQSQELGYVLLKYSVKSEHSSACQGGCSPEFHIDSERVCLLRNAPCRYCPIKKPSFWIRGGPKANVASKCLYAKKNRQTQKIGSWPKEAEAGVMKDA